MVTFLGIMDFGFFFAGRVAATNATRIAARYAAANPTNWSYAGSPTNTSIQGQLVLTAVPAVITNDDTHVVLTYLVPGTLGAGVVCGTYSVTDHRVNYALGYTQASCVIPGNLVSIKATYTYTFITPMLSSVFRNVTISTEATEIEEV